MQLVPLPVPMACCSALMFCILARVVEDGEVKGNVLKHQTVTEMLEKIVEESISHSSNQFSWYNDEGKAEHLPVVT